VPALAAPARASADLWWRRWRYVQRANPNQLIIIEQNKKDLAEIREILVKAHQERCGTTDDLLIGFQLTHSGRFCKPNDKFRMEPRVAYRHPILDKKFKVTSDDQVFTDDEIERLIECYWRRRRSRGTCRLQDIKHCHGYCRTVSARTHGLANTAARLNRTRILREIIAGIGQAETRSRSACG
jgi:hypothetical protein